MCSFPGSMSLYKIILEVFCHFKKLYWALQSCVFRSFGYITLLWIEILQPHELESHSIPPHLALYFLWVRVSFFLTIVTELLKYLVSQVLEAGRPGLSLQIVRPKPSRKGASKIRSMLTECSSCTVHRPMCWAPKCWGQQLPATVAHNQKEPSCTISWLICNCGDDNRLTHWLLALRPGFCQGHSLFPCFSQFSIGEDKFSIGESTDNNTNTCLELCELYLEVVFFIFF